METNEATEGANLRMDSADFAVWGRSKKKAKDPYHSFKLNTLARRYQFIFDGKGIVRGLWEVTHPRYTIPSGARPTGRLWNGTLMEE